jgi:hypothetical protein
MAAEQPQGEKSFKVQDRRRFSESGEARPDTADDGERAGRSAASQDESREEPQPQGASHTAEISFASFVIGLSTQALALLGEIQHPEQGTQAVDLVGTRQIIDILGLLREKTRGNLDEGEHTLLESALYDLRMMYVQKSRSR